MQRTLYERKVMTKTRTEHYKIPFFILLVAWIIFIGYLLVVVNDQKNYIQFQKGQIDWYKDALGDCWKIYNGLESKICEPCPRFVNDCPYLIYWTNYTNYTAPNFRNDTFIPV